MNPQEAVLRIWQSRAEARERQALYGRSDSGLRSEVTSGGHMDDMSQLIADVFVGAGLSPSSVHCGRSRLELPGYFRPEKKWDIVAMHEGKLVAAIELKCIASSYGNNMNNRAEEAMGNAVDLAHAIRSGLVGSHVPWLGYVFVIRDEQSSRNRVGVKQPHFAVDQAFIDASYQDRARLLCSRLALERLYDKTWFVVADPDSGAVSEPDAEMTWLKFEASIRGKVAEVLA